MHRLIAAAAGNDTRPAAPHFTAELLFIFFSFHSVSIFFGLDVRFVSFYILRFYTHHFLFSIGAFSRRTRHIGICYKHNRLRNVTIACVLMNN